MNSLFAICRIATLSVLLSLGISGTVSAQTYPVAGTNQTRAYNNLTEIAIPAGGMPFYGQNANFQGDKPKYTDNGDGTITDEITGLLWQKSPDRNGDGHIDSADKMTFDAALAGVSAFHLAAYTDWRLPSIKELYSLILFSGLDPSGYQGTSTDGLVPFIDTAYFDFGYGDQAAGERIIDAQYWSATKYVSTTMLNDPTAFGVNFADGRIKGYPSALIGPPGNQFSMKAYVKYVRGNTAYGKNDFRDNGDGTISDLATDLMWMQNDNGTALLWEKALNYAENAEFAGYNDWRLPSVKELQSIVDYTRSPASSNSAAIAPVFNCTAILDEGGKNNYPFYWSNTTHANWSPVPGGNAAYVCFGTAPGWMQTPPNSGNYQLLDVHGAGAQRSDPKAGDPGDFPYGHGPQGDVIRIFNYVRLVRDIAGSTGLQETVPKREIDVFPNPSGGRIEVVAPENTAAISIYNAIGQLVVRSQGNGAMNYTFDLQKNGVYRLVVGTNNGQVIFARTLVILNR